MSLQQRILVVCGAGYVSGKEVVSLTLGRTLREVGFSVEFVASSWNDGDFRRRLDEYGFACHLLRLGFFSLSLQLDPLRCSLDQLRYLPTLIRQYSLLTRERSPRAVIHSNWQHSLLLMPFLRPSRDVQWLHEMVPQTRRYGIVFRAIAARTGGIVCVSHAVAQSVLALGVPEERVSVIHNGVAAATWTSSTGEEAMLRVGIVGQIAPWKGHEDLLDALALLTRSGQHIILLIFGAGEHSYMESLKRKIADLGLCANVQWRGFVIDQTDIYSNIDVCVMPSRFEEPFGMSALEAGAHARPVICTSRGGLIEIIQDRKTGLLVDAQRPDQLAHAIGILAHDRNLLRRMGAAAQAHVQSNFSSAAFGRRFASLIGSLSGTGVAAPL
jgi:glycosyltransferase involved in cell wall biosynthesis